MKKFFIGILSLLLSSHIFAAPIKDLVFFGDSLSDDGNLYHVLKVVPKSPPYYLGRFSNGPTWAEFVGKYFYDKSYLSYSNYAYGGATAILHNPMDDSFIAPVILEEEITGYLLHSRHKDRSQALYAFWIGANDYLYDRSPDVNLLTDKVINKIAWSVKQLIEKGGEHFLLLNLPDLSKTPFARDQGTVARLAILSHLHKEKFTLMINDLKNKYPQVQIIYMDIYSLFLDILNDPEKYNEKYGTHVTDTENACWLGTILGRDNVAWMNTDLQKLSESVTILDKTWEKRELTQLMVNSPALNEAYKIGKMSDLGLLPCDNAGAHLFWDNLHPTAVIHGVLGQIVIQMIEGQK